jgi:hypothetical protein
MTMKTVAMVAAGCLLLLVGSVAAQSLPGEKFAPPAAGKRQPDLLTVGAAAPDFTLPASAGEAKVRLADYRGQKPVVLIFGSCT